jgi:hypothetical protein
MPTPPAEAIKNWPMAPVREKDPMKMEMRVN